MNKLQTCNIATSTWLASLISLSLITLTLACGYRVKAAAPVAGTVPTISQLAPDAATAGAAGFVLTVNGTNFGSKAVVNWNGVAPTANTTDDERQPTQVLWFRRRPSPFSGTVMITVTNPGHPGTGIYGTGASLAETSASMDFTIH